MSLRIVPDHLRLIAQQIDDPETLYQFALVCHAAAQAVREITQARPVAPHTAIWTAQESRQFYMPTKFDSIISTVSVGTVPTQKAAKSIVISSVSTSFHKQVAGNQNIVYVAPGRGGEGHVFLNGAKRPMRSKRHNGGMTWAYDPAQPEIWGDFPPTSTAEAIDRLAARLYADSGETL